MDQKITKLRNTSISLVRLTKFNNNKNSSIKLGNESENDVADFCRKRVMRVL